MSRFVVVPLTRDKANKFVGLEHRHNRPVVGHLFAIGACCEAELKARGWAEHSKKRKRVNKSEPVDRYRWELLPQERAS